MSGTINFISALKLETDKVLSPMKLLEVIRSGSVKSVNDFYRELGHHPLINCLEARVGGEAVRLSYEGIHREAVNCWLSSLRGIMELTSPDRSHSSLVNLYLGRYELREVINALRMVREGVRPEGFEVLGEDLLSRLSVDNVSRLVTALREAGSEVLKLVADSLVLQGASSIKDVDISRLKEQVIEAYWRRVYEAVGSIYSKSKLNECLRTLKTLDLIEEAVRESVLGGGKAFKAKLDPLINSVLERFHGWGIDLALKIVRYVKCCDELKYSPLSADTLMPYLISKEVEVDTASLALYMISRGLIRELEEVLGDWVRVYEEVTSK